MILSAVMFFTAAAFAGPLEKNLIASAKENNSKSVKTCLSGGASPNAKDSLGNSALVIAVNNGNESMAEDLIRQGAYTSESYMRGMSVLMLAINKQMEKTASLLIKNGADTTVQLSNGTNALMMASERNLANVVSEIILTRQVDINKKNKEGYTALSIAIKEGNIEVAKLLHKNGAVPGNIIEAAILSDIKISRDLLKNGADIEMRNDSGMTPLLVAFLSDDYSLASFLLENGADINARDYYGMTPVLAAAMLNNATLTSLAIEHKANILAKDINGLTPLMFFVFSGNLHAIELIVKYDKASVNSIDNNKNSPVVMAVCRGDKRMTQKLIEHGANLNSRYSKKALNIAVYSGNLDLAAILLQNGARVNAKDINGVPPLIVAVSKNDYATAKFLIENGARINVKDSSGFTPLDYAKKFSNEDMLRLLGSSK